jgi:hypothetical protein
MSHAVSSPPLRPGRRMRNSARYSPEARASCAAARTAARSSGWTSARKASSESGSPPRGAGRTGRSARGTRRRSPLPGPIPKCRPRPPPARGGAGPRPRAAPLPRPSAPWRPCAVPAPRRAARRPGRAGGSSGRRRPRAGRCGACGAARPATRRSGPFPRPAAAAAVGEARAEQLVGRAPQRFGPPGCRTGARNRPTSAGWRLRGAEDGGAHVEGREEVGGQGLGRPGRQVGLLLLLRGARAPAPPGEDSGAQLGEARRAGGPPVVAPRVMPTPLPCPIAVLWTTAAGRHPAARAAVAAARPVGPRGRLLRGGHGRRGMRRFFPAYRRQRIDAPSTPRMRNIF